MADFQGLPYFSRFVCDSSFGVKISVYIAHEAPRGQEEERINDFNC